MHFFYSDTPLAALSDARLYGPVLGLVCPVSGSTQGEIASLVCSLYLSGASGPDGGSRSVPEMGVCC